MLTDFGFQFHDMARSGGINKTIGLNRLNEKINEIDKTFNLVILADEEYFEETHSIQLISRDPLCSQPGLPRTSRLSGLHQSV